MDRKGFLSSTAALFTAVGTMIAALVALGVFLLGEGVLSRKDGGGDPAGPAGAVQSERRFGRDGTTGIELDSDKEIQRNPQRDPDIQFFTALDELGTFDGRIVEWTAEKPPTEQECADLLETHGATGTFGIENGRRFCVLSSGGRTAYLAVINDGNEYLVSVWKKP